MAEVVVWSVNLRHLASHSSKARSKDVSRDSACCCKVAACATSSCKLSGVMCDVEKGVCVEATVTARAGSSRVLAGRGREEEVLCIVLDSIVPTPTSVLDDDPMPAPAPAPAPAPLCMRFDDMLVQPL